MSGPSHVSEVEKKPTLTQPFFLSPPLSSYTECRGYGFAETQMQHYVLLLLYNLCTKEIILSRLCLSICPHVLYSNLNEFG
jgi:hypothetical protein